MIPRLRPPWGLREVAAALRPPRGSDVDRFEAAFARLFGQRHAIAFPYGRTALAAAFEALGAGEGDEVVCPAYTCVVVAHAISRVGATPVFVDARDDDFNMDLALLDEAVTERTRIVVATSIFGHPVDLDALDAFRARHPNVHVIQDCAHSFRASFGERPVPPAGDCAIVGLNASKIISSIFGGMLTTDDDDLARRVRAARDAALRPPRWSKGARRLAYFAASGLALSGPGYGVVNRLERSGLLDRFTRYYDESIIDMPADWNDAMQPIEARVGLVQTARYDDVIAHRRRCAARYRRDLGDVAGLRLPPDAPGATYSHFVTRMDGADALRAAALRRGVQLGALIEYVVPRMTAYRSARFVDRGVADRFPAAVVNLPVHLGVTDRALDRIAGLVREHARGQPEAGPV